MSNLLCKELAYEALEGDLMSGPGIKRGKVKDWCRVKRGEGGGGRRRQPSLHFQTLMGKAAQHGTSVVAVESWQRR